MEGPWQLGLLGIMELVFLVAMYESLVSAIETDWVQLEGDKTNRVQLGGDIDGETALDLSGLSVSVSADGTMAIGAADNSRVYSLDDCIESSASSSPDTSFVPAGAIIVLALGTACVVLKWRKIKACFNFENLDPGGATSNQFGSFDCCGMMEP